MLCCGALLGALAAPANAVIPEGNLLANPGFENFAAATNATEKFPAAGWTVTLGAPTAVFYGVSGFPTTPRTLARSAVTGPSSPAVPTTTSPRSLNG